MDERRVRTKEEQVIFDFAHRVVNTYQDIVTWPEFYALVDTCGYLGGTQPRPTTVSGVDVYIDARLKALKEREENANFASRAALAIDIRKHIGTALDQWVKEE